MQYEVELKKRAVKDLSRLDPPINAGYSPESRLFVTTCPVT
jgi:mRNA-degrading endonuclease RelE of RelBE toxin-antitoxin system